MLTYASEFLADIKSKYITKHHSQNKGISLECGNVTWLYIYVNLMIDIELFPIETQIEMCKMLY